jgi:hypothetical protein
MVQPAQYVHKDVIAKDVKRLTCKKTYQKSLTLWMSQVVERGRNILTPSLIIRIQVRKDRRLVKTL